MVDLELYMQQTIKQKCKIKDRQGFRKHVSHAVSEKLS